MRKLKVTNLSISYVPLLNLNSCNLWAFSDAAHANLKDQGSQLGYVIFAVDRAGNANLVKWCSKKISRVVKSSLAAETLALLEAVDNAYFIKRLLESMLSVTDGISIYCFTDNKSLVDHVYKSTSSVKDFRLRVDMACLRDMMQRNEIKSIKWVDTNHQLADCLTKATASSKNVLDIIKENKIDLNLYSCMQDAHF